MKALRTLLLVTLAAAQILVAGQAFAMPECHQMNMSDIDHSAMSHSSSHSDNEDSQDQTMQCQCPQGQHCGHCSVVIIKSSALGINSTETPIYTPLPRPATTLGFSHTLERPPSHTPT
jgi:hypothetical protein